MGNTESRLNRSEIVACIGAIEDELTAGDYDGGVTPESVISCLRTMLSAAVDGGGNVVVPKAIGVDYGRDIVVPCYPKPKSRYSGSVISVSSRGWDRPKRKPSQYQNYAQSAVESVGSTTTSPSEVRKLRMQARHEESRRRTHGSMRSPLGSIADENDITHDHPASPGSSVSMEDTMERIAGLNIRRTTGPMPTDTFVRNDPPIFRGPPTQRTVGTVRDRARAMEGRA